MVVLASVFKVCWTISTCLTLWQCVCVSAHHSYLIRLSSHYWSDFPKNYIMGASLKSTRLTRAPFLTSLHTKTHTHTLTHGEIVVRAADLRHTILVFSSFVTISYVSLPFPLSLSFPPLTAHLSGTTIYFQSSVQAKYLLQCVEHITSKGALLRQDES